MRSAGDLRFLTDGEADALLAAEKQVDRPVAWTEQTDSRFVRMEVPVSNALSENLYLTGRINRLRPGVSGWALIWGRKAFREHPESIRRLDLRDTHRNPDGQWWRKQTHKHRWSAADNNDWAYTPDDIPHDQSASAVDADDYRAVFEAFAAECGVSLGRCYRWEEPVLTLDAGETGLWEP